MSTRIESADETLRVEVGPGGVIVTIDGHEWQWVVSGVDSSLHLAGSGSVTGVWRPGDPSVLPHDLDARRPEDCRRCAKFLLESEGAGVHETEAARRNKNVSGAANCGRSGARGNRAACFPAPISLKR